MNWFNRRPEDLTAQSNPTEALKIVRECEALDASAQETLDYVLVDWVAQLVSRSSDLDGVVELQQLCSIACTVLGSSVSEREMHGRWQGYADVLEAKRLAIRFAKSTPTVPLLHEEEILQHLESKGEVPQSFFSDQLKLSAGRVSQILRVLELREKIKRERCGKESWVSLPQNSAITRPDAPPNNANNSHKWGGIFDPVTTSEEAA